MGYGVILPGKPVTQQAPMIKPNQQIGSPGYNNQVLNKAVAQVQGSGGPSMPTIAGVGGVPNAFASEFGPKPILQGTAPITQDVLGPNYENLPGPMDSMDPRYWDIQREKSMEDAYGEFYGPTGLQSQVQEDVASRGLVGDEIEQAIMAERVDQPYQQRARDIDRELMGQRIKSDFETEQFNKEIRFKALETLSSLRQFDSGSELERQAAQADIDAKWMDVNARLIDAREGRDVERNIAEAELMLQGLEISNDRYIKEKQLVEEGRQFDVESGLTYMQIPGLTDFERSQAKEQAGFTGGRGRSAGEEVPDDFIPLDVQRFEGNTFTDPESGQKFVAEIAGYHRRMADGSLGGFMNKVGMTPPPNGVPLFKWKKL